MSRIVQGLVIGSSGGTAVQVRPEIIYYIDTAPVSQPVDTGITNAEMLEYSELTFTIVSVTAGGARYAVVSRIFTAYTDLPPFVDLKFTRSIDYLDQIGGITLSIWLDGTSGTVQYQYDVDGAGVTFESATMIGYNFSI